MQLMSQLFMIIIHYYIRLMSPELLTEVLSPNFLNPDIDISTAEQRDVFFKLLATSHFP